MKSFDLLDQSIYRPPFKRIRKSIRGTRPGCLNRTHTYIYPGNPAMDKTLEFVAIQVVPSPHFPMIIERPGLSRLGTN